MRAFRPSAWSPLPWRRASAVLAAGALATAGLASGCGSSSAPGSVDAVAQAATRSNAAAGYRLEMTMRFSSSALPQGMSASGSGSFSPAQRTGSITLTMQSASPAIAQAGGGSALAIEEVISGSTIYVKLPAALSSRTPGGKPWLKVDLARLGKQNGMAGLGSLFSPTSSNPAQMLQYLRASSGGITKVGTAQIDGRRTTAYRASIDLAKYPDLLPESQRAAARQAIQQLEAMTKLKTLPSEVWVDDQHLVRQMSLSFNEQLANSGQSLRAQITIRIPQYGPQPAPRLPPPDQVSDLGALTGRTA